MQGCIRAGAGFFLKCDDDVTCTKETVAFLWSQREWTLNAL